jgi:hypothetical protein
MLLRAFIMIRIDRRAESFSGVMVALGLIFVVCASATPNAFAQGDDGPQDDPEARQLFVKEYPQACKRLMEHYTSLRIHGKLFTHRPIDPQAARDRIKNARDGEKVEIPSVAQVVEWETRGANGSFRCDQIKNGQIVRSNVESPKWSFELLRLGNSDKLTIRSLKEKDPVEAGRDHTGDLWSGAPLGLPYVFSYMDKPLSDIVTDKHYKILKVYRVSRNDKPGIRVEWSRDADERGWGGKGYCCFAPRSSWVLTEFEQALSTPQRPQWFKRHGTLEYKNLASSNIPLLKSLDVWSWLEGQGASHQCSEEILEIEPRITPEGEFTLEHFGLSREMYKPIPKKS